MKKLTSTLLFAASVFIICAGCASKPQEDKPMTALELMKAGKTDQARGLFQIDTDINATDSDGNTLLHLCAAVNDYSSIEYFLFKGADSEIKNKEGNTALHLAIENDAYSAAKVLAAVGSNLFARNGMGETALDMALEKDPRYYDIFINEDAAKLRYDNGKTLVHYFVSSKNIRGVNACIKAGLPISVKDEDGKAPLDLAFEDINNPTSVEIAAILIQGNAEPVETNFSYFQDAVASRNLNLRLDDGQTPLHLCAIMGHNAIASYLLENNANTSVQDSSGATPLHEAIRYGNLDIARMLLDAGANINAKDNLGKTPIMLIIPKAKITETYQLLIRYKADLNQADTYGDTVLHTATMLSAGSNVIKLLTSNGADINARNKEGVTPLAIAIQSEDIQTIKYLTANGASIHTQDTHGKSPLSMAFEMSNDVFEATLNEGNCNTQDSDGNTPLHIALINTAPMAKIQHIIGLTQDVNIRNKNGDSPLYLAAVKNLEQVGKLLLEKGADIFSTNKDNNSPLRLALKNGGLLQNWLITSRTIVSTDGSGNTVLHYAADWEYAEAIKTLLEKGADINAKNANGETCLFNAAKSNNPSIIQLLVDGGASVKDRDNLGSTPLHIAVRWGAQKSAEKLIKLGININAQNSAGKSPLAEAVIANKYDVAKYLLENGADPNSSDANGITILMDTIRAQNAQIVKLLLNYGANPNLQQINGQNAYHEAAYMGNTEIIALIRNAGGNPLSRDKEGNTPFSIVLKKDIKVINEVLGNSYNITDSDGNSPLHIVVKNKGSTTLLRTLIDRGYPLDTRNADGYTPLNYAIEAGNVSMAEILLEKGANPFQTIDKKGTNGVTIALDKADKKMIESIVKYAAGLSDIQGNTILHYAAKTSSIEIVKLLLSYGITTNTKNVAGDTPYTIAVRWKRPDVAELLK
ncbi:MAG: ankyrin repeat domain-containing protein [Treponema sp.]|nr:ankyrin repeat domain-containing protein [Treponema sp.]